MRSMHTGLFIYRLRFWSLCFQIAMPYLKKNSPLRLPHTLRALSWLRVGRRSTTTQIFCWIIFCYEDVLRYFGNPANEPKIKKPLKIKGLGGWETRIRT